jgi:hypothetical protein
LGNKASPHGIEVTDPISIKYQPNRASLALLCPSLLRHFSATQLLFHDRNELSTIVPKPKDINNSRSNSASASCARVCSILLGSVMLWQMHFEVE